MITKLKTSGQFHSGMTRLQIQANLQQLTAHRTFKSKAGFDITCTSIGKPMNTWAAVIFPSQVDNIHLKKMN